MSIYRALDGKVEVRIEDTAEDTRKNIAVRVDGQEVLAFEVSASIKKVGVHDYSDGCDAPKLEIKPI